MTCHLLRNKTVAPESTCKVLGSLKTWKMKKIKQPSPTVCIAMLVVMAGRCSVARLEVCGGNMGLSSKLQSVTSEGTGEDISRSERLSDISDAEEL